MNGEISELDGDTLPRDIDEAIATLRMLKVKYFKEHPYTAQICQDLRDLYSKLKPFMPILSSLKNVNFMSRHFELLKKDYDVDIASDLSQTLNQLKDLGVMDIVDEIIELSATATKEKQLDVQLQKMMDEWKQVRFELLEYRNSEVPVLTGVQNIWDLLDEHI